MMALMAMDATPISIPHLQALPMPLQNTAIEKFWEIDMQMFIFANFPAPVLQALYDQV